MIRQVTRLSDVAQILNLQRGGPRYTTLVYFPSCVRSLVLYKAFRRKRKEVESNTGTCKDSFFHSGWLKFKICCNMFTQDRTNTDPSAPIILHND